MHKSEKLWLRAKAARRRVVTTPRQTMKWALRFVNDTQVDQLSERDWDHLQAEVAVFIGEYPEFQRGSCYVGIKSRAFYRATAEDPSPLLPSKQEVAHYQAEARSLFESFLHPPDGAPFPRTIWEKHIAVDLSLKYFGPNDKHSSFSLWIHDKEDLLKVNLLLLIGQFAPNVKACKDCDRYFLAKRTNQSYCSNRCATRVMQRRKRGRPLHKPGKRGRPFGSIQSRAKKMRKPGISPKRSSP